MHYIDGDRLVSDATMPGAKVPVDAPKRGQVKSGLRGEANR
jgi:hypothetical protein